MLIASLATESIQRTDQALQSLPGDPIVWAQLAHGAKALNWNELAHRIFIWHGGRHIDVYDEQAIFKARLTSPEPYTLRRFIDLTTAYA